MELTIEERESFFNSHLPYRLAMLNSYRFEIWNNEDFSECKYRKSLLICSVESSRIASRIFIEFFGLGVRNNKLIAKNNRRNHDVCISDLGGKFVRPDDLSIQEQELLVLVYQTANKSTAHLTFKDPDAGSADVLNPGNILINRLLKENLYDIVK